MKFSTSEDNILQEFEKAGAILRGHFVLSSGLHSDTYLQCARVMMEPRRAERLCAMLVEKIREKIPEPIHMVASPAMGGVVVGYEIARQLGVPAIFCERVNGVFTFRRGFNIPSMTRVLVVEDVITTGKSSEETFACVRATGGLVIGEACLVDRSSGLSKDLNVPIATLMKLHVDTFRSDNIPERLKNVPATKPGSRWEVSNSSSSATVQQGG